MNKLSVKKIFYGMIVFLSTSAIAPIASANANVTLMATVNDVPAFSPVHWAVFRVENNARSALPYVTDNRHSLAIDLPPGRYVAEASLNNVSRTRMFDVVSRSTNNIVVALD